MAITSKEFNMPACVVLSSTHAAWAQAVVAYCAQATTSCFLVDSSERVNAELSAAPAAVLVVSGAWNDAACARVIHDAHRVAPDVVVMVVCDDGIPTLAEARGAGVFAVCKKHDEPAVIVSWLAAALDLAQSRLAMRRQRESLQRMVDLSDTLSSFASMDEGLHAILTTAVELIPATGALLLMQDDGTLRLSAALPPYDAVLDKEPPEKLMALAMQAAERRVPCREEQCLAFPLLWRDRARGVVWLEGDDLPTATPEAMALFIAHAAAALENAILYDLAAIDRMTSLLTRTFTIKRLFEEVKSAYRTGHELTVLMMDLDHFKEINDSYGHLAGDRALHEIGVLLHAGQRETDILGRYGGDEFLAILPNTSVAGGFEVAQRIQRTVANYRLNVNGLDIPLGISIGIGSLRHAGALPDQQQPPADHHFFQQALEMLIAQADTAMYHTKNEQITHIAVGTPLDWPNT